MKTDKENYPVEVFAGTAVQANLLRSLLENAEIEAFLNDEFTGTLYPWHTKPGGVGAVNIFVSSADYEKAMSVVNEYESNLRNK